MVEKEVVVVPEQGIHARPASRLVAAAKGHTSDIVLIKGDVEANAKSPLKVMTLGAKHGDSITIRADGERTMPSIDDIINERLVALDLSATDNFGAIEQLSELLDADGRLSDKDAYVEAARAREQETGGTAMEMGIAIPHAKSGGVREPAVAFGRTPEPIQYGDEKPATYFSFHAFPFE